MKLFYTIDLTPVTQSKQQGLDDGAKTNVFLEEQLLYIVTTLIVNFF